VLEDPEHRVGDAVHVRQERLCDDRNSHATIVPVAAVRMVACRDTTRKSR
jgi:hypothetical protein